MVSYTNIITQLKTLFFRHTQKLDICDKIYLMKNSNESYCVRHRTSGNQRNSCHNGRNFPSFTDDKWNRCFHNQIIFKQTCQHSRTPTKSVCWELQIKMANPGTQNGIWSSELPRDSAALESSCSRVLIRFFSSPIF